MAAKGWKWGCKRATEHSPVQLFDQAVALAPNHARALKGVAKSQFLLKAVVFESR